MWSRRSLRYRDGEIEEPGGGTPNGAARIILLVHGYNNDKAQAEESYAALTKHVPDDQPQLRDQIWMFFWPSYVERITGESVDESTSLSMRHSTAGTESNIVLSIPTYSQQVLKARDVGRELGRYLRGLERSENLPTEIVFVAHSLGCRVVLEALRELLAQSTTQDTRARVPCMCLMAAAVPTFMVEDGERLGSAAELPQMSYILHSRADLVLRVAFPFGQGAASLLDLDGAEGWLPEAVGRNGHPLGVWLRRANTGLGHSEYWTHPSTAPAVLRAVGKGTTRGLGRLSTLEQVTWTLPSYPDIPDWQNRAKQRERHLAARPTLG
jgi:hypothetical protein